MMVRAGFHVFRITTLAAALSAGLVGCAPTNTNTAYSGAAIGRAAYVSQGVILSMREVTVSTQSSGIGTAVGIGAGGVAGSAIGGGTRANILGAIGGAVIGGLVGAAVDNQVNRGVATEFIIREDTGATIAVVQTNEERFGIGEYITIIRGDRTRLARATVAYPQRQTVPATAPGARYRGGAGYAPAANGYPDNAYPPNTYPGNAPRAVYQPGYGYPE